MSPPATHTFNDVRIAALARQHALPLLSNNTHFDRVDGVERIAF